jgi:cytochrome c554/c'-like protein
MPREESIAESAKQRSLRVPLDHYEQPHPLVRAKWRLSAIVGAIAAAYLAWLLFGSRAAQQQASPGQLAASHATWNDDCLACHQNFKPLRSDALLNSVSSTSNKEAHRESLDAACVKCHNTPVHHAAAKADEVPNCAACHRDHNGLAADIVRPADARCLDCHRHIDQHRDGASGLAPATANVTGFGSKQTQSVSEGPHPEFRSLQNDPGNIKFNHWLHLQPGVAVTDAKHKVELADLDERWQARFAAYAKAGGLLQLNCAACHQSDRDGKYMLPIAFEEHCRACHRLEVNAKDAAPQEVPHGMSAQRLSDFVGGFLLSAEKSKQPLPATTDESGKLPLIPGRTLGENLAQKISQDVLAQRAAALRGTMTKCLECHFASPTANENVAADIADVAPANVPAVWLRHARFDHRAHRHVECRSCHAAAYAFEKRDKPQFINPPAGTAPARDEQQVMIAGLENCASCHAPAHGSSGGARHGCAECHLYHGGDAKLKTAHSVSELHSLPGSSLGTPFPEAPASSAVVRSVSLTTAKENHYVGASSCASSGCHGDAREKSLLWQKAFTIWASDGPHSQAYEVLWTVRGREMTRRLSQSDAAAAAWTDDQHRAAIEQRCLGCHATPSGPQAGSEMVALGVTCESCHGAAEGWLHTHYRRANSRDTYEGFNDTKKLTQRAAACMKCHVGPSHEFGAEQAVDHDLIAAGHPRLAFEFDSYFSTLPPHWNPKADKAADPPFHFRAWLAGQTKQLEQRPSASDAAVPDFAQLDCASCHHDLAANSWRQKTHAAVLKPVGWPHARLPEPTEPLPILVRLSVVKQLLASVENGAHWETALQSYLALRALMADFEVEQSLSAAEVRELQSAAAKLGEYLARDCFPLPADEHRQPTTYDSPTAFSPDALAQRVKPVLDAIQRLESKVAAP